MTIEEQTIARNELVAATLPFDIDVNNVARQVVGGAVGLIPYGGKIASTILLYFWTANEKDIWLEIEGRARALVRGMINEERFKQLKGELEGLKNLVAELARYDRDTDAARTQLQTVINFFEDRQPFFCDKADLPGTLPFFIEMATMHLVFLKARCDDPKSITKDPVSPETLQKWKEHLRDMIVYYRGVSQTCWESATAHRRSKFEVRGLEVFDALTESTYAYGCPAGRGSSEMNKLARVYTIQNQWQLDYYKKFMLTALSWAQLDPINPRPDWADAGAQHEFWLLGLQDKSCDTHGYNFESLQGGAGRLEYLDVWSGKTIERIEAKFAGSNAVGNGVKSGTVQRIQVPAGEYVKSLQLKMDDKAVAIALVFSGGARAEVGSGESGRIGSWREASFPEYGVGGIHVSERVSGIRVDLRPAGGLLG